MKNGNAITSDQSKSPAPIERYQPGRQQRRHGKKCELLPKAERRRRRQIRRPAPQIVDRAIELADIALERLS